MKKKNNGQWKIRSKRGQKWAKKYANTEKQKAERKANAKWQNKCFMVNSLKCFDLRTIGCISSNRIIRIIHAMWLRFVTLQVTATTTENTANCKTKRNNTSVDLQNDDDCDDIFNSRVRKLFVYVISFSLCLCLALHLSLYISLFLHAHVLFVHE